MKKFLLVMFLCVFFINPTLAANWLKVNDNWQIDIDSITTSDKNSWVWAKADISNNNVYTENRQKVFEYHYYFKFNTSNNKHIILREYAYDHDQNLIETHLKPFGIELVATPTNSVIPILQQASTKKAKQLEQIKKQYGYYKTDIENSSGIDNAYIVNYPSWFYSTETSKQKNFNSKDLVCLKFNYNIEKQGRYTPIIEYFYIDSKNNSVYDSDKRPANRIIQFDNEKIVFSINQASANMAKDYILESVYNIDRYTGNLKVHQRLLAKSLSAKVEFWIDKHGYNITDKVYSQGTGTVTKVTNKVQKF